MLPRRPETTPGVLPEDEPDPEAELRARLLLYRAHRDAGRRLQEAAIDRFGLFRREPAVAGAAGLAGARPPEGPPLDVAILPARARQAGRDRRAARAAGRRSSRARSRSPSGRRSSGRRSRGAGTVVLQDLLARRPRPGRRRGDVPRDARADEAARDRRDARTSRGGRSSPARRPPRSAAARGAAGRAARRGPGVVRVIEERAGSAGRVAARPRPIWTSIRPRSPSSSPRPSSRRSCSSRSAR